jgi:hypothetical protein
MAAKGPGGAKTNAMAATVTAAEDLVEMHE